MQDITYIGCVYPWQCDQVGHMNVMWYVGKFDEASWSFLARLGFTPSYLRDEQTGMAALQQNITYKRELVAGDLVEIRSDLLEVREKVLRYQHEMKNAASGEIAAICELIVVHIDRTARKSCPFPAAIREQAELELSKRSSTLFWGAPAR